MLGHMQKVSHFWAKIKNTKGITLNVLAWSPSFCSPPYWRIIPYLLTLTFWEISIGVNFIWFPRNDERFDFWPWKLGVDLYTRLTYTWVNTVAERQVLSCATFIVTAFLWFPKWNWIDHEHQMVLTPECWKCNFWGPWIKNFGREHAKVVQPLSFFSKAIYFTKSVICLTLSRSWVPIGTYRFYSV